MADTLVDVFYCAPLPLLDGLLHNYLPEGVVLAAGPIQVGDLSYAWVRGGLGQPDLSSHSITMLPHDGLPEVLAGWGTPPPPEPDPDPEPEPEPESYSSRRHRHKHG